METYREIQLNQGAIERHKRSQAKVVSKDIAVSNLTHMTPVLVPRFFNMRNILFFKPASCQPLGVGRPFQHHPFLLRLIRIRNAIHFLRDFDFYDHRPAVSSANNVLSNRTMPTKKGPISSSHFHGTAIHLKFEYRSRARGNSNG